MTTTACDLAPTTTPEVPPLLTHARTTVLILEAAAQVGLPAPRGINVTKHGAVDIHLATLDDLTEWADFVDADHDDPRASRVPGAHANIHRACGVAFGLALTLIASEPRHPLSLVVEP